MRRSPRVAVDLPATLEASDRTYVGRVANLSLSGAFVRLAQDHPGINSVITLKISLGPRGAGLEILSRIVRTAGSGLGVEFLDLDSHCRSRLRDYLAALQPHNFTACPYCGQELPRRLRKTCPGCLRPLDWQTDLELTELPPEEMIGACKTMRDIFSLIRKVAVTEVPVLITGESGTGKEMVARAIHQRSHWATGPFVEVNCGALSPDLLEAELFGHEKGVKPGPRRTRAGYLERAHQGTLFLNEVHELSWDLQLKLLRFLQEYTFCRLGGHKARRVDLRLISASSADLRGLIDTGRFREDFYNQLNIVHIHLPPLRDREDDVLILANIFLKRYARRLGKEIHGFTPEAVAALRNHAWPGNVRELINRIRRAAVLSEDSRIAPEHLALSPLSAPRETLFNGKSLKEARAEFEARLVTEALQHFQGNVFLASKALKVSRSTMYHFIQKYQLKPYLSGWAASS